MSNLKPCPFCGEEVFIVRDPRGIAVVCAGCESFLLLRGPYGKGENIHQDFLSWVVEIWNTRP